MIWPQDKSALQQFINHINIAHPIIRFTNEISPHEIPFLDHWYMSQKVKFIPGYTLNQLMHICIWNIHLVWRDPSLFTISQRKKNTFRITTFVSISNTCVFLFSMERLSPWITPPGNRTNKQNSQGSTFGIEALWLTDIDTNYVNRCLQQGQSKH